MATLQVVKYGVRRLMETEASIADNLRRQPFKETDITISGQLHYSVNLANTVVICPAAGKALKQSKYPQSENFVEFSGVAITQQ